MFQRIFFYRFNIYTIILLNYSMCRIIFITLWMQLFVRIILQEMTLVGILDEFSEFHAIWL